MESFSENCSVISIFTTSSFSFVLKVTKLQSDISPLHHSLSVLSEKNGSLQADKRILEDELKRWKAKTQVCVFVCEREHWQDKTHYVLTSTLLCLLCVTHKMFGSVIVWLYLTYGLPFLCSNWLASRRMAMLRRNRNWLQRKKLSRDVSVSSRKKWLNWRLNWQGRTCVDLKKNKKQPPHPPTPTHPSTRSGLKKQKCNVK